VISILKWFMAKDISSTEAPDIKYNKRS